MTLVFGTAPDLRMSLGCVYECKLELRLTMLTEPGHEFRKQHAE